MKIYGLTVGKNEAARYLWPMLDHALGIFDDVFYYDDQSDDTTPEIIEELNPSWVERPDTVPSFVENEGLFRQAAWDAFEIAIGPRPGDWCMVIDCDEALVSWDGYHGPIVRGTLEKVITAAGAMPVNVNIPEVWGFGADGTPLVRVDRLWNTIHAPRLFPYRPNGRFASGDFGVPAVPSYAMQSPWFTTDTIALMHYGYAEEIDQFQKYQRYIGHHGHSNAHVESIVAIDRAYNTWPWPYPPEMRAAWTLSTS